MSRQGQARDRTVANVKDFWNKEASEWGDSPRVTIRDHYMRLLEIETVSDLIRGRKNVLDIGCGTGFSTLHYAQHVDRIIGADFAENMVEWAQKMLSDKAYFHATTKEYCPDGVPELRGNIRFEQGDALHIDSPDKPFDAIVAERVLINLPTVELQDQAAREIASALAKGGRWVMVEVTKQGHRDVDRVRKEFGLPQLEKYWHNLYIDEDHFAEVARSAGLTLKEIQRFETYQFLTKVMHPLVTAPEEPQFMVGFNDAARAVAKRFPTYASVKQKGLKAVLNDEFRPLVAKRDAGKLDAFDRVAKRIVEQDPDFTGCSHQVLFVLER